MNPNVTVINPTIAEEKESKIRVAAYCRVSTDSEDQLNSYMAQMRHYEKCLSESETETLVSVYADEGITGTRMDKREDFQRMLKDCRRGKIDRIIVKSISRFARNTKECLNTLRELKGLGISVVFEKENIDTAMLSDEIMVTVMGGLAQEESASISQNMRWSVERRMKNGTFVISHMPYGYSRKKGNYTIEAEEAEIIKRIFRDFLSGKGVYSICNSLNAEGVKRNDGRLWDKKLVRYILGNEKYIGDCLLKKTYTADVFPFKKKINRGEVPQYYVTDNHEQIISKEDFEKVQELLKQRSKHYQGKRFDEHTFSRKIYCGYCSTLYRRKRVNDITYWVCYKHDYKAADCESKRLTEESIKSCFIIFYNKLKINYSVIFSPMLSQLQELKNKRFSGNKKYIEINKEIAQLKEQTHVLARLKTKGFLDESKYLEQTSEINLKIEKLYAEQRKISKCDDEDEVIDQIKELASIIDNGSELMAEFDEVMFESLIEKIIVKNHTELEFNLYGGLKFTEKV